MSHHNSGPRAHALPQADITDMYVFPAPDRPGGLILVMNVVPFADPDGVFAPELIYRFRLRPLVIDNSSPSLFAVAGPEDEIVVDCTFDDADGGTQRGTCSVSTGAQAPITVNSVTDGDSAVARVFAGPRWDPFFDDATALVTTLRTGKMAFTESGSILGDGKNVLSIVVDITTSVLGTGALVAVVGETLIAGRIPVRWERFGRPELENAILGPKDHDPVNRDLEIRDLFNSEDAFAISDDYVAAYRARLTANLEFWDGLDGETAWPVTDGTHPLTELFLADFLVVDHTKPYGDDTFLEIESAVLAGRPHDTSGGRSPNNASMPALYTLLINGNKGPRITDGVKAATKPATRAFPYLIPPNPEPPEHGGH